MDNDESDKLIHKREFASLEKRVKRIETIAYVVHVFAACIIGWLGFWGCSARQALATQIEKLEVRETELLKCQDAIKNDMMHTSQQSIELNTQLSGLSNRIAEKYDELLQRCSEIQNLADKAQQLSNQAITNSGMLVDAVKASNLSADRAQKLAADAQEAAKKAAEANADIQKNLQLLDSFLSKKIPVQPQKFKVDISGRYGVFYITAGKSLPYDRKFSGSSSSAHIAVPPDCTVIIKDEGSSNTFYISSEIQSQVILEGKGNYRKVRFTTK